MNGWFRSWHGAPTDPKWSLIARRADVAPGIVAAVFWALLDHASLADERGDVSRFDPEAYAAWAGFDEDSVRRILAALDDKGIIVGGRLEAWERRQPKREDDTNAERQRRYRERLRTSEDVSERHVTVSDDDKRGVTQSNAASRPVTTDKIRVEEIREETKERDEARASEIKRIYAPDSEEYRLALLLRDRIHDNYPNYPPPSESSLQRWSNTVRLMFERDHRAREDIVALLEWSQRDSFWQSNIRSMDKLREKWDTLDAHRTREERTHGNGGATSHAGANGSAAGEGRYGPRRIEPEWTGVRKRVGYDA